MRAICKECGKGPWELRKDPAEYDEEPRCSDPDCRSREIVIFDEDGEEAQYSEAFQRFERGDDPIDLVKDGVCSPQEAREMANEFEQLSEEYQLYSESELQVIRADASDRGYDRGFDEGRREGEKKMRRVLKQRQRAAYQSGYDKGWMEAWSLSAPNP